MSIRSIKSNYSALPKKNLQTSFGSKQLNKEQLPKLINCDKLNSDKFSLRSVCDGDNYFDTTCISCF